MKDEKKVSIFCPISKRFFKWISIGDFDNHFFCELNFTLIHRKFSWNCWSTKEEKKVWPSVQTAVWKCNSEVIGNFICSSFNTFALSHTSCVMNEPVWNSFFSFLPQSCTMYTDTLCFHSDLGRSSFYYDRVRCRCFFFSPFASKRPRFSSLFFVGYCLFFRRLCIGCLLHLNIVAHNLHVVYCQFYACSLYRRAIAHCSATHNLCVLPVCFGVAEYIQYFFSVVHSLFVAPVMYSQHQSTSSCLISVSVFFLC